VYRRGEARVFIVERLLILQLQLPIASAIRLKRHRRYAIKRKKAARFRYLLPALWQFVISPSRSGHKSHQTNTRPMDPAVVRDALICNSAFVPTGPITFVRPSAINPPNRLPPSPRTKWPRKVKALTFGRTRTRCSRET
jgi:hypothetical protein